MMKSKVSILLTDMIANINFNEKRNKYSCF